MAYIANTAFEVTVSNSVRNQTQNVPGLFGSFSDDTFTGADCSAGQLCVRNSLVPISAYSNAVDYQGNPISILNGNTWYFTKAVDGSADGRMGDHTGIYACNTYDVQKLSNGTNVYNVGAKTLGLGAPANVFTNFTELIVGEQYTFGAGNFTADVSTNGYATISSNGLLTPAASAASDGVYFKILRSKIFNEGTSYVGTGYVVEVCRAIDVGN